MQIEVGKCYRTRDGRVAGPIEHVGGQKVVWKGPIGSEMHGWKLDGGWTLGVGEHRLDLVAEAPEPLPADLEVQSEFEALKDRVGRLRDSVDERLQALTDKVEAMTGRAGPNDLVRVADLCAKLEARVISLEAGARVQAATIRRLSDQVGGLLMERALPAAVAADPVRAEAERAGPPTPRLGVDQFHWPLADEIKAALAGEVTGDVGRAPLPPGSVRELAEEVERLRKENERLTKRESWAAKVADSDAQGEISPPPGGWTAHATALAVDLDALRKENGQLRRAISDAEAHIKRMGARA